MTNYFNERNYLKTDKKNAVWKQNLKPDEYEQKMLKQRGFEYDYKNRLRLNHNKFIQYAIKRIRALNYAEKVYFYNFKNKSYEKLEEPQYKKIFFYIIEEASTEVWKKKMESEYIPYFLRKLPYAEDNGMKPGWLHFPNAIIDMENQELYEPTPDIFSLVQIPYNYDENAEAPLFMEFLNDIFEGDQERIDLIQEIMGTCLYYEDVLQKLVVFLGSGSNGKSLLSNIIKKMLGEKNVSAIALDKLGGNRFSKQNLDRKLLNISSETKSEKLYSTSDLKTLTGGDSVEIEEKFEKSYTTEIHSKFILLANDMIQTKDYSDGFYRRLLIIPFNRRYQDLAPGQEPEEGVFYKDVTLEERITEELPGIFNFAFEGLLRYVNNDYNLTNSSVCNEALEHYKNEHNVVKAFINECLTIHEPEEKVKTKRSELFPAFKNFCYKNQFSHNMSSIQFLRLFRNITEDECLGIDEVHLNTGDYMKNVSIRK